jgi:hypothetical protein
LWGLGIEPTLPLTAIRTGYACNEIARLLVMIVIMNLSLRNTSDTHLESSTVYSFQALIIDTELNIYGG